ncbi:MAG TPA: GNAT family N-acetyltransferase [Kofleriaceae bacterium]|nr:GNAT family N-acetyltransferase [Kofleriaceae bacterium]
MAFEVRAATEAERGDVAQLIREMIPGVAADARLAWLYEKNPAGRALTWIARENGELAGCTSYFPWRLVLDGEGHQCALGGDGYVRPKFRRRGLGALLHDAARDDMTRTNIGCMYGAPGAMNLTPLKHGGSREIGHVARWARPLRGAALGVKPAPLDKLLREVLRPRRAAALEPMVREDERVDEVWRELAPTMRLAAVRDATFYTWRFLDAPSGKEPAFVITDNGRPIGACALEVMNEGKSVRIVDVMAIPDQWHRCLSAIASHVTTATDAHFVDIKLMALDGRRRHMWRAGFTERDSKPFLVVIPKKGDRRFLDPTRWFYGGADSDLDFLE